MFARRYYHNKTFKKDSNSNSKTWHAGFDTFKRTANLHQRKERSRYFGNRD